MVDYERVADLARQQIRAALCTVTETTGSTPRKAGTRMLVVADGSAVGRIEGTIGGGAIEHQIRQKALEVIAASSPAHVRVALTHELGMCCGGQMSVFIEPLRQKPPCIVFGAGHIAHAFCHIAALTGFAVTVADPRQELVLAERFALASQLVEGYSAEHFSKLPFGPDAFILIATHDHKTDQELAEQVIERQFRYAALVGSKRKAALTVQRCLNKGISAEQIQRLHCPAGLDIGAQSPEEIAISIVAQMVKIRYSADGSEKIAPSSSRIADKDLPQTQPESSDTI